MTTTMLDPRVTAWLETGPQAAPPVAFDEIMAAVATTAQEPRRDRLAGRVLPFTRPRLLLAAAVVLAAVATGGYLFRDTIADVATPPRDPSGLLYPFPETRTVVERTGGPATTDETVAITKLSKGKAFVVAASCTGGGSMTADLWDRSIVYEGDPAEAEPLPNDRLPVTCNGTPASMRVSTLDALTDDNEVTLAVRAGASWRAAVGEVKALPDAPAFRALETGEGAIILIDRAEPVLAHNLPGAGIGIQLPPGVTTLTALVQCAGDPIVVSTDGREPATTVNCTDPEKTHRIDLPAVDGMDVHAGTEGLAWVRLAAEVLPGTAASQPEAPELPAGLADVSFAEGDGSNVAFGTLGGNDQTVIAMANGPAGSGGGGTATLTRRDGAGTVLDLWRPSDATLIGTLATISDGEIFGSWVDATHRQVFYGVTRPVVGIPQASWHRVGFDGSGDVELAAVPMRSISFAQQALAVDDSAFVIQWCVVEEACERVIFDAASGDVRRVSPSGGAPCDLLGVIDGSVVLGTGGCESTSDRGSVVAEDLDGGPPSTLREGRTSGVLVYTSAGPAVVLFDAVGDMRTSISIVGLDGSAPRDLGTVEHESGMGPRPSSVRLPAGDWILLAGPIGDTPGMRAVGRPVPVLLNVMTGERIELPNLPHSP